MLWVTYEELSKLTRTALTQLRYGDGLLLIQNQHVLFRSVFGFQALPRQRPFQEINQYVRNGLQIISPTLLDTQVVVNAGVSGSAREGSPVPVRYVLEGLRVPIPLRETEINAVYVRRLVR
jgi:hypothetical protein